MSFKVKQTWIYILNMLPTSYMILNKLLNISELNFLFGRLENNNK